MTYSIYSSTEGSLYHPVVIKDDQRFWKRILIVDDEADVRTFKAVIEESNNNNDVNKKIEDYTSNNPVEALSEFKPNFYDLLLVDINMPDINGFELCEKMLAIDINFKVCFMSYGEMALRVSRDKYRMLHQKASHYRLFD
jgi:CheY-like chemotaxis protein